jgi:hypothetical protein
VTGGEAGSPPPAEPLLGTASESADLIQADSGPGNYRTKHAAAVFLSRQSGLVTREQYVFRVVWTATFARVWPSTARLFIYLVCHAGRVSIRFPPHWLRRSRRPASGSKIVAAKTSTFTSALCPQAWHVAISARTPFRRMLPKVMGGPGFSRAAIGAYCSHRTWSGRCGSG